MSDPFANLVQDINKFSKRKPTITRKQYEEFKKEFIFESLKGVSFGKAFCENFGFSDYLLSNIKHDSEAMFLIENLGYLE